MNLIAEILRDGESEQRALMPPRTSMKKIGRTVCGMLNQQGGKILWGIDAEGKHAGFTDAEKKAQELTTLLMTQLVRRPLLSVNVDEYKQKKFVLIEIPQSADKPYFFERQIWVRVGKQLLRATEDESAEMVMKSATRESVWGRDVAPGFELIHCDDSELKDAKDEMVRVGRFGIDIPVDDEAFLRRLYLLKNSQLTNAAVVLFASDPLAWSPNLALRIISYASEKQGDTLLEQSFEGPAVRVLRRAVTVIQQQTGVASRFKPNQLAREDRPAYAPFALREGLVNAMVHRDYESMRGQLRVEIFPQHLIIQNPGRLPEGWTEKDIITKEESHPTNPDIARVFHLRNMMERLGLGGRKLMHECVALEARPPIWKAAEGVVSLTLFRAPQLKTADRLADRQKKFLRSLKRGQDFKTTEYAEAAGVSTRQARRDLSEMEDLGLIEHYGKGRATAYRRVKDGHE